MANKVLGMHRLKNKVNRNAFDLSHRHMFTAQVGELLPVFTQWVNPNETFRIGYNGKTRTAALNTDAFTRIRENIQYYFVPFQSLWKYFEQQVNNMTTGDAGQNISRFAGSSTEASTLTTSMPYISYTDLAEWLWQMYSHLRDALNAYFISHNKASSRSALGFKEYCDINWNVPPIIRPVFISPMIKPDIIPTITENHDKTTGPFWSTVIYPAKITIKIFCITSISFTSISL